MRATPQDLFSIADTDADDLLGIFAELDEVGDDATPPSAPTDSSPPADADFEDTPPTPYPPGVDYTDEQRSQKEVYSDDMLDLFAEMDVEDAAPEPKEFFVNEFEEPTAIVVGDDTSIPGVPNTADSSPPADSEFEDTPVTPYDPGVDYTDEQRSQKEVYSDDMLDLFAEMDVEDEEPHTARAYVAPDDNDSIAVDAGGNLLDHGEIFEVLGAMDDEAVGIPSASAFWGAAPTTSDFWSGNWGLRNQSNGPTSSTVPQAPIVARYMAPAQAAQLASSKAQLAASQAALHAAFAAGLPAPATPQQSTYQTAQAMYQQPVQQQVISPATQPQYQPQYQPPPPQPADDGSSDPNSTSDPSADPTTTVSGEEEDELDEVFGELDEVFGELDEVLGVDGELSTRGPIASTLTSAAGPMSKAFNDFASEKAVASQTLVAQHPDQESARDWQIDFGPASAPAGEVITLYNNPQCLFRGEKVMANDTGVPAGSGTRITRIVVGQKVQRPNAGSTLTQFFAANALANGILWDTTDPAYQIAVTVSFVQSCTFDLTVFGRAQL